MNSWGITIPPVTHPLAPLLPRTTRFLLEQVCVPGLELDAAAPAPPEPAPAPSAAELATEARRQMIAGVLHAWAQAQPPSDLRDGLLRELAPDARAGAMAGLNLVRETLEVMELLRRHGIQAIALKGAMLSKRYYGDFGTRDAGDVDVLVDEAAAVDADRRLQEAGYERTKPRRPLSGRRLQLYLDTQHEFGYRPPEGSGLVELHWRFADCRLISSEPFSALWSRSETLHAGGAQVRVLGPPDTFQQLAIHGYTDGWSRLKWIADLPRALSVIPANAVIPAKAGIQRITDLALALAGRPITADWLPPVLAYIASRLAGPHPRTQPTLDRLRHARAMGRYHEALLDNAQIRRDADYCNLIMPADFDRLPLPDALTRALPYLRGCSGGYASGEGRSDSAARSGYLAPEPGTWRSRARFSSRMIAIETIVPTTPNRAIPPNAM